MHRLPPAFAHFWEQFRTALPEGSWCGLVGGTARDLCSGQAPKDIDLEVLGAPAEPLVQRLQALFPGQVNLVGRSFAVLKIAYEGLELDVAIDPRETFREVALRRDFTVNSMAIELPGGALVDPFGGKRDWQQRVLRQTSPTSLADDPLRVLRAVQFAARFEMTVEKGTLAQMRALAHSPLPVERATEEWKKLLLRAPRPSVGLELLRRIEGLPPELAALIGVPQEPRWHPEGDVWTHTVMVVDQAARLRDRPEVEPLTLMLAALCHDLGKPISTRDLGDRITSDGHEAAGRVPAGRFLERFCFPQTVVEGVLNCVAHHMRPPLLVKEEMSPRQRVNALRRLVRDTTPPGWPTFIALCEADKRGRGFADADREPFQPDLELTPLLVEHRVETLAAHPLLRGRDLLELGVPAGPEMGRWIQRVEEQRDEGLLATREEALDWLRERLMC